MTAAETVSLWRICSCFCTYNISDIAGVGAQRSEQTEEKEERSAPESAHFRVNSGPSHARPQAPHAVSRLWGTVLPNTPPWRPSLAPLLAVSSHHHRQSRAREPAADRVGHRRSHPGVVKVPPFALYNTHQKRNQTELLGNPHRVA